MARRLEFFTMVGALGLAACGSDGAGAGMQADSVPAKLSPGTTIQWNPTITVVDSDSFTYENDGDSAFTASIEDGTYTYSIIAGIATLTLKGNSADDDKLLSTLPATLLLAKASGGLEIEIDDMKFSAVVTLPAASSGGGAGTGGSSTSVEGSVPAGATAATVNAKLVGSHDLTFGNAQAGAPFEAGDTGTFVIGADNTLTALGKKIGKPYTLNGNAAAILWNDGEHTWEVTNNQTGVFNEINVQEAATDTWLGQWADASKFETPVDEGDFGKDIDFTITGNSASGTLAVPYAQGIVVTVNWDGDEQLTIEAEGETLTPAYIGDEPISLPAVYGEETVVRALKWSTEGADEGQEYVLKLDANDKIAGFEARNYKVVGSSTLYSKSTARRQ